MRAVLAAVALGAGLVGGLGGASAIPPEPCRDVHVGTCYVHDETESYTCAAYVRVGDVSYCLFKHQP